MPDTTFACLVLDISIDCLVPKINIIRACARFLLVQKASEKQNEISTSWKLECCEGSGPVSNQGPCP